MHRKFRKIPSRYTRSSVTVLSPANDPFRQSTKTGHRDAKWFREQMERFLSPEETVHLRGLHYRIVVAADVVLPNGMPYGNTDDTWTFLVSDAAKAARWLGYVPFERIVDERNAPPEIFVLSELLYEPSSRISTGLAIELPSRELAFPHVSLLGSTRQPYRIVFIGEKVSLAPVLRPIAQQVHGELLLPTGEITDTQIAEFTDRAVADGRPTTVLYFSDFDPSGHQM
jgi:hypothetical protein